MGVSQAILRANQQPGKVGSGTVNDGTVEAEPRIAPPTLMPSWRYSGDVSSSFDPVPKSFAPIGGASRGN